MNENSSENTSTVPAAGQSASRPTPASRGVVLALALAVIALVLTAWQWYGERSGGSALREEVAKQLAESDAQTRESRSVAAQGREALTGVREKLAAIENRLAESQKQRAALDALYQELSRNREEWVYAEIEQSLFVASQQLQLAGNANAALRALQAADARLQRLDRPELIALRKAINRDIERLKAAPQVDTVAISARLEVIAAQVDSLPLAMDTRPRPEQAMTAAQHEGEDNLWTRFWRDTWREMKQLIRVQQLEKPDAALLAPAQAYFLRENLKLRLIGARLALLSRDSASYKADLKAAGDWLGRYYDTSHKGVTQAAAALRSLHDAEIGIEAPEIGATLEAMRKLRATRERGGR
jgi:uroporphyrin-3 C-methyltransferase